MDTYYRLPVSREYETRGCSVKIDAYSDELCVDIVVRNIKTGLGSSYRYALLPENNSYGYTESDIVTIRTELNRLLDDYGDPECSEIHFTNQILS